MAYEDLILKTDKTIHIQMICYFSEEKKSCMNILVRKKIIPFIPLYVDHTVCKKNLKRGKNLLQEKL